MRKAICLLAWGFSSACFLLSLIIGIVAGVDMGEFLGGIGVFLIMFFVFTAANLILAILATVLKNDSILSIWTIVLGFLSMLTTGIGAVFLVLGIILLVKTDENKKAEIAQSGIQPLTDIDKEISSLKKQIEYTELKKKEQEANAEKYKELENLKEQLKNAEEKEEK